MSLTAQFRTALPRPGISQRDLCAIRKKAAEGKTDAEIIENVGRLLADAQNRASPISS